MKNHLYEAFILCAAAIIIALISNGVRSDRLPLLSNAASDASNVADEDVRPIAIETAIAKFEQGDALFADARPAADYAAGHIAGAVNLPAMDSDQWLGRLFNSADPEQTIIAYCSGPNCILGKQLARTLGEAGFAQVYYLVDGWGQWTSRKLPIETGQ